MTQRQERLLKHNEINILKSSCPAQTQKIPAFKQCFSQSFIIMCCIFNKLSLTKYLIYRNDVFTIITRFLMLWLLRSIYYKVPALLSNEKKKRNKKERNKNSFFKRSGHYLGDPFCATGTGAIETFESILPSSITEVNITSFLKHLFPGIYHWWQIKEK